ncbi:hypothetical protein [Hoeflea ulvae]|uniref:YCII-related domain-containing protein n=1 Tax=Hoeflea ulvae TaxID=2983764 RepID=A0ABT3YG07_9HYPH|nr:hypothetical protein [Hoeflea ulvae]MCY0094773.1 hypothetical protein [Hoeflea ulvae]
MKKFALVYHGNPQFETAEDGASHMVAWKQWVEGLGDALVDPGMAVGPSRTISAAGVEEGGGSNPFSGITIIQANTMETAIDLARACPHINAGGTIEIAEDMQLAM